MSLYYRYKRWRGEDTTTTIEHEQDRYEYTVTHLNGEVSKAEGNVHVRDEGFLLIQEKDDDTWARATFHSNMSYTGPPAFSRFEGYNTVRELEGVQEVEREKIGTDKWIFAVDKADEEWIDTEKEYEGIEKI